MRKPIGGPSCGNMPYQARLPSGAFSTAIRAAPPHSPPSPTPCTKRKAASAQRREHARACVRRQRADQRRRQPHGQHGRDERRFASDPIAEMAEQERAHGPREKGEAEGQIGVERLRLGRRFRKEHRPEHERRRGAEDIEVVELDRRADEARERDLADARALRFACPRGRYLSSWSFPRIHHPAALAAAARLSYVFKSRRAPCRSATPPRIPSAGSSPQKSRAARMSRATSPSHGSADKPSPAPPRR